ncbi:MAG TPA: glycoside hydrolase family 3 N-terminal domain-containing protein [Bacteroidota bacterium]|nr:glycoside hydrolase family 3 N-terminal domain-containing protein [Bacteroidota bacterium]
MKKILNMGFMALMVSLPQTPTKDAGWVETTLRSMTLEEKIGQLFVVDLVAVYAHRESPAYRYAVNMIKRYHVGGFVLAGGTVTDIAMMTNALQRESKVPLIFNADLESGLTFLHPWRHVRGRGPELPRYVPGGGTQFPSLMAVGATGSAEYAASMGAITAREARAVGIHWTNSPVADINNNPENPVINTRSFGEDPEQVARLVEAYVRGLQNEKALGTLKHFPGHGDTEEDTHMMLPVMPFDQKRLEKVELVPFRAGIAAGAKAVMTAHLALPRLDTGRVPATLSSVVIDGLLRKELGFRGIVVTDGMTMQGITDYAGPGEAAVLAVSAGADVVLVPEECERAYEAVLAAVRSGRITESRIHESVRRILSAKEWLGLNVKKRVDPEKIADEVGAPESLQKAAEISDRSITLLRNESNIIPLRPSQRIHLVIVTDQVDTQAGLELEAMLAEAHFSVTISRISNESGNSQLAEAVRLSQAADISLVGVYLSVGAWKGKLGIRNDIRDFLGEIARSRVPSILTAFGDPYVLGKIPLTEAILAAYNGTVLAERSVVKAITGAIPVSGRLPVTIPGRYKRGDGLDLSARPPLRTE